MSSLDAEVTEFEENDMNKTQAKMQLTGMSNVEIDDPYGIKIPQKKSHVMLRQNILPRIQTQDMPATTLVKTKSDRILRAYTKIKSRLDLSDSGSIQDKRKSTAANMTLALKSSIPEKVRFSTLNQRPQLIRHESSLKKIRRFRIAPRSKSSTQLASPEIASSN